MKPTITVDKITPKPYVHFHKISPIKETNHKDTNTSRIESIQVNAQNLKQPNPNINSKNTVNLYPNSPMAQSIQNTAKDFSTQISI